MARAAMNIIRITGNDQRLGLGIEASPPKRRHFCAPHLCDLAERQFCARRPVFSPIAVLSDFLQ